jgi:hypothetical protein
MEEPWGRLRRTQKALLLLSKRPKARFFGSSKRKQLSDSTAGQREENSSIDTCGLSSSSSSSSLTASGESCSKTQDEDAAVWQSSRGFFSKPKVLRRTSRLQLPGLHERRKAMHSAVRDQNLELVQFLFETRPNAVWPDAADLAAKSGALQILQFLCKNGCSTSKAAMNWALEYNHLAVAKYLHTHTSAGCTRLGWDRAAANNHTSACVWLQTNRGEGFTAAAVDAAAGGGHAPLVFWLHSHCGVRGTARALYRAAAAGELEAVRTLLSLGYALSTAAVDAAARGGHLAVLVALCEAGAVCSVAAMDAAATGGHMAALLYLHNKHSGAGCTTLALDGAAGNGECCALLYELADIYRMSCICGTAKQDADLCLMLLSCMCHWFFVV